MSAGAPRGAESASDDRQAARRRRRIKSLEEEIASLEKDVEQLENRLSEEALTLGPVAANNLARERSAKREELDALVEEWAALSEEESRSAAPRGA